MLFNSLEFAFFLPIVFVGYWFIFKSNLKYQNAFLLVCSYIFYGWWDWKFLGLIAFSTVIDYSISLLLHKTVKADKRKFLLVASLLINLGFLAVFKYYNFFVDNINGAFSLLGVPISFRGLDLILPVGISFYTFQTLSYTIDVYNRNLEPTKDFIAFAAFVSFFPQLVAGPIERASNLLPQFYDKRNFDYHNACNGMRQILWGLFKKMVVADLCAEYVNEVFKNTETLHGLPLVLGAIFFAFQIYGDFSGYSDIAIGTSRLFGFNLMRNFAYPYFSRDMAEFWRRWHISLSTWFRDYIYLPLGGSKGGIGNKVRNTFIIFLISGFWHGANWTFIVWGALNAAYFLPLLLTNSNRKNLDIVAQHASLPTFRESIAMVTTFLLACIAWVFFRAQSVNHAIEYLGNMFQNPISFLWVRFYFDQLNILSAIAVLLVFEWVGRREQHALEATPLRFSPHMRAVGYVVLLTSVLWFSTSGQAFIYFQF